MSESNPIRLATWLRVVDQPFFREIFARFPSVVLDDAQLGPIDMEKADGLLLTGGEDISIPFLRQPVPDPALLDGIAPERDAWEFPALERALERRIPVLAICRGHQVLNVALGGTLHQHLPEVVGDSRFSGNHGVFSTNTVSIGDSGIVPALLADTPTLAVQSYHHQGVDEVAPGLSVTAEADGIVQAVEVEGVPFGVAVQWHPEQSPEDLRLFQGLVEAARSHHG